MKVNGDAIYGTAAGPFKTPPAWGRATSKNGRLYLHIFDWPAGGNFVFTPPVATARLLASSSKPLSVTAAADGSVIHLPAQAPDPVATVVVVEPRR
jgi:alpha-L-fucosidase